MPENPQDVNFSKVLEPIINHPVEAGADVTSAFSFHGGDIGVFAILFLFFFLILFILFVFVVWFLRKGFKGQ